MYVHILLLSLLRYFCIKIFLHVDETENILHNFFKHSVFLGQPRYAYDFLISALYYACNMLRPLLVKSLFMVTCVLNF